jgi:glutamyl-tRNA synthetase
MFNFLALLGWSPGDDDEILSADELIRRFSLDAINRKSAIFDTAKLEWLNGRYLAALSAERLLPHVRELIGDSGAVHDDAWLLRLIDMLKVRVRTVRELAEQARPYLSDHVEHDADAVAKHWRNAAETAGRLEQLRDVVAQLAVWDETSLENALRALAERIGIGAGKLIHPWRVALTGVAASPGIFDVAILLGRDRVLQRTDDAITLLREDSVSSAH